MLNSILRFALSNRLVILAAALLVMVYGSFTAQSLKIDVFPNLTRPRVVLLTEAPGMAPEEVESLVTFPLETSLNGATGVEAVRTASGIGLSVIYVEFGWDADIYDARQIVQERLVLAQDRLPPGAKPFMAPISSIMGQIMVVGMWTEPIEGVDPTSALELRTIADWTVKQRLLAIPGVSQVITLGGGRKQYQVLVNPEKLLVYKVTLHEVELALKQSNLNVTGGYVDQGSKEYLVRGLGRVQSLDDLRNLTIKTTPERSITIGEVATVEYGPQIKRGDASVNGHYPGVLLTVLKQPEADTRRLTEEVTRAIEELQPGLPADVRIDPAMYQQRSFIDRSIANVAEALRDGAILVVIVLFLFLFSVRTTFITLTAIPLSVLMTALIFDQFGLSINVMTLGGIAIAMGELVDDAIVDVENIFRRLRENSALEPPRSALRVVYEASLEVRASIVFGTMVVILVFLPLFALSGMEGRLFAPLGIAYVVSILASLLVSLTVTPVLSYYLLGNEPKASAPDHEPKASAPDHAKSGADAFDSSGEHDALALRWLKRLATPIIRLSMSRIGISTALSLSCIAVVVAGFILTQLGSDFLPPFDEGAAQINMLTPPGTSLETSNRISATVDARFRTMMKSDENPTAPIDAFFRRTGRAEDDEHAEGVYRSEFIISLNPESGLSREETLAKLRGVLDDIPGIESDAEQPLAHLISHMLSGVYAQIAIKIYGDDLDVLRAKAHEIEAAIKEMPELASVVVEPQTILPQMRVELDRSKLEQYGLTPEFVLHIVETSLNGSIVSRVLEGQRTFDMLIRLEEPYRVDLANLHRLTIRLPDGGKIPLGEVAKVYEGGGPNTINRENVRRRISISVNTKSGNIGGAVEEIRRRVAADVELPEGYFLQYGGQFEAQEEATSRILLLGSVSLVGIFLVLFTLFRSVSLVLQILIALPAAFVGGVIALSLSGQTLSVAAMVGFISLGGIATRNGILLVSHYLRLIREEGKTFSNAMILRGSLERLAPVLMTALTTGIGLIPLIVGGQQPGKEILYPVATVIVGGLVTSTLAEFFLRPGLFRWFSGRGVRTGMNDNSKLDAI